MKGILELTSSVANAVDELAFQTKEKRREEKEKQSLLGQWTEGAKELFHLLSADKWSARGVPHLTKFALEATKYKQPQRAINLIIEQGTRSGTRGHNGTRRKWAGMASESGMMELLTKGFLAADFFESPGGFTAFMCRPKDQVKTRSKHATKQHYQDLYGTNVMSEETLEALVKQDWFLPKNRYEAVDQLSVAIDLLELLVGKNGIASKGYRHGKKLLKDNSESVRKGLSGDPNFLWKFVHLLDSIFQRFCERLLEHADRRDPIREARREGLDVFQVKLIDDALGLLFTLGHLPNLSLPNSLSKQGKQGRHGGDPESSSEGKGSGKPEGKREGLKKDPATRVRKNFEKNPSAEPTWSPPEGKEFHHFFAKGNTENQAGFPPLQHHKKKGKKTMCLKYQVNGECSLGENCSMAHVPPSQMTPAEREAISARFKVVYA
jgi:hypothetical protein